MEIKFQDKLLNYINGFNISTLSHTILLKGTLGSGRHLICNYISKKFELNIVDISKKLDEDTFSNICLSTIKNLYIIDIDNLLEKEQNSLLKILEEPNSYSYFILIARNSSKILPTIINRCFELKMGAYSKEELNYFIKENCNNKDLILSLSNTPGDVISFQDQDLEGMIDLSNKMIQKMSVASFPNALSISDKIAFKNEKSKYDFNIFIKVLYATIINNINYSNKINVEYLKLINDLIEKLSLRNLNLKYLFENFLAKMWKVSRV